MIELSKSSDSNAFKMRRSIKTGDAKWADIGDLINRWAKRRPQKARELEAYIKDVRGGMYDKDLGGNPNQPMGRLALILDPELEQYIKAFYPDFLSTKSEMHEFMNKFPKFKMPDRT